MAICCCCCQQSRRKVDSEGSEPLITEGKKIIVEASANDNSSLSSVDSDYIETDKTNVDDTIIDDNVRGEPQPNELGSGKPTTSPKSGLLGEDPLIPKEPSEEQSNLNKHPVTAPANVRGLMKKKVTFFDAPNS